MKRILLAIAICLVLVGTAFAGDLEIKQVLVDPIGSESGGEFVELENTGLQDLNLSGYFLKTETSDRDVTLPSAILEPGETFLITDTGWNETKDDPEWKGSDYEEDMTLKNTNDGIALIYNETIIDSVGWGLAIEIEEGLYEGIPFLSVEEGLSYKELQTQTITLKTLSWVMLVLMKLQMMKV